jgi:hypothetical protein
VRRARWSPETCWGITRIGHGGAINCGITSASIAFASDPPRATHRGYDSARTIPRGIGIGALDSDFKLLCDTIQPISLSIQTLKSALAKLDLSVAPSAKPVPRAMAWVNSTVNTRKRGRR